MFDARFFRRAVRTPFGFAILLASLGIVFYQYLDSRKDIEKLRRRLEAKSKQLRSEVPYQAFYRLYGKDPRPRLIHVDYNDAAQSAKLSFQCPQPCRFFCADRELESSNGEISVPFPLTNDANVITKKVTVVWDGHTDSVTLKHYPRALYGAGAEGKGSLISHTTLPCTPVAELDPFAMVRPHQDEMRQLLDAGSLPYSPQERALGVLRRLADLIASSPRSQQRCLLEQKGWEIMKQVRNGWCYIDCAGKAIIGRDYLLAAGIQARAIHLISAASNTPDGLMVLRSEGHATNEVLASGRWSWFDLTMNVLYVRRDTDSQWLSLWMIFRSLESPRSMQRLRFAIYDPATKQTKEVSLAECPWLRDLVMNYLTSDKVLRYLGVEPGTGSSSSEVSLEIRFTGKSDAHF